MLLGREHECARLVELLERTRSGTGGALVVRGEAGIGKSALLDYAAEQAEAMNVVRAVGVESEAELEFSGLLEVCWPLRDRLNEISERQADALRAALGLAGAEEQDRFSVGAATLGLLAAAADARPLLVLVDDAHWLDASSLDALLFATRRLEADPVVFVYAAREGEEQAFEAPGLESIRLGGLPRDAATSLLRNRHVDVAGDVADRLYSTTGGNPLALLELPALLSPEQLAGTATLDDPLPAGSSVERAFARRAESLPASSRQALLVAAVSSSSEVETVVAALAARGLDGSALEPAEDSGLLRVADGRLEFRHPLVRSAVYHAGAPSERRAAHAALAKALVGSPRVEARAWHLAGAALGPDEEAAEALEQAAKHARSRSGYAAAAAALERAARLSPDPRVALERLAAAADGAWQAGRTETAGALVAETLARADHPGLRARALRLHGAIEYFAGNADTAARALVEAFELLERSDPSGAVAAAADAVNALVRVRQPAQAVETAEKARALALTDGGETDLEATVALGFALCFSGRYGDAEPHLRRAVDIFEGSAAVAGPLQAGRLSAALAWQGRFGVAHAYMTATVGRARAAGAVGTLPHLLAGSAWQALHASRWDEAAADAHEALELAEELGQPVTATQVLGVLTWIHALRGDEGRCRAYGDETRRRARAFGFRLYDLLVSACFGVLDLGAGRVDDAIGHLEEVARYADERGLNIPGVAPQFDLAEACIRAGRAADAETILASFERSELASAPFLGALAARCRGLSAQGDRFEEHFAEALALHARIESPFALARTQLCYGERLRRARRRAEARTHLRAAHGVFERLGAQPWAARAADELGASGSRVEASAPPALAELTPHELRVASIVASGATNQEVASRLFVTPKTVEYHLRSIYRKLGLRSRSELTRLYVAEQAAAAAA